MVEHHSVAAYAEPVAVHVDRKLGHVARGVEVGQRVDGVDDLLLLAVVNLAELAAGFLRPQVIVFMVISITYERINTTFNAILHRINGYIKGCFITCHFSGVTSAGLQS